MRISRAVNHLTAGLIDQRTGQHMAHPIAALHPASIVYIAGALETRPHGQQVLDGDRFLLRVFRAGQMLGEKPLDGFVNAFQVAAIQSDADERR